MQSNLSFYIILSTRVLFGMLTDSDYGIKACLDPILSQDGPFLMVTFET